MSRTADGARRCHPAFTAAAEPVVVHIMPGNAEAEAALLEEVEPLVAEGVLVDLDQEVAP